MAKPENWIPEEILDEILPRKVRTPQAFGLVFSQLKTMILSGKLRKGEKLVQEEIAGTFGVSLTVVSKVYAQLQKDKLIVQKRRAGTFACDVQSGKTD